MVELDNEFKEFLGTQKSGTASVYATYLRLWIEYSGMNGQQSIEYKRNDKNANTEKLVLGFQQWLLQKGLSPNSAKTACGAIRGFYAFKRLPLIFIRQESKRLNNVNRVTSDYLFSKEDLYKMAQQGNLIEKYILLVGKSLGLRASDFLALTYGHFRSINLNDEPPIPLGEIHTIKENTPAYPFLDSDAVEIVKLILERNTDKPDNERILNYADEQPLTLALKRMFTAANLVSGGKRIRFHCLRKYLCDRLSSVASESQWKMIVGKKVNSSDATYLSQDQLREIYRRAMSLTVVMNNNIKNSETIRKLQEELKMYKTVLMELLKDKLDVKTLTLPDGTKVDTIPVKANKWTELYQKLQNI
jgi:integrase